MDTAEQIFALTIFATLLRDGYAGDQMESDENFFSSEYHIDLLARTQ